LHAIVQRSPKDGNSAPADHPEAKHYTTTQDLLADSAVDVIVVTTPPDNHFDLTKAALESGKHVLTEKPFVPTSAEAEKLIDIAKANNRLICVYQNRRWDSDFLTVKHLLSKGTLGRVFEYNTHFDRYKAEAATNWKGELGIPQGGSAIFDLGTHLIDQAYVLFGMPQSVHGRVLSQRAGKPDYFNPDAVSAELTYPDGKLIKVNISAMSAEVVQQRFWIRGTQGSFHKTGLDLQEDQLKAGQKPTAAGFGKDAPECMRLTVIADGKPVEQAVPDLQPETYMTFYKAFANAVETGKEEDIPVKPTEARDVLRIIEAVLESAKSGKDVTF
ncbi:hypothetical protein Golomagni_06776, partial [Golovinomyces magnicellulatus]